MDPNRFLCLRTDAFVNSDLDSESLQVLVGETLGMAIADTGCSKTVSGQDWMDVYIESLSSKDRNSIRSSRSSFTFRFGDGRSYKSKKKLIIPFYINNSKHYLRVDIVDCCIPLLISRYTLKRAKVKIDVGNNRLQILGQEVPLITTSTGHKCFSVSRKMHADNEETQRVISSTLFNSPFHDLENDSDLDKKISLLHSQFSHPTPNRPTNACDFQ